MTKKRMETTLREFKSESEQSSLIAYLNKDHDLVFEGFDHGEWVKKAYGDSDYEYWRTIPKDQLMKMLFCLIEDKFETEQEIFDWLEENNIPSDYSSWN